MAVMREQAAEKKSYPPVYGHSVQYAKEHGELEAFNESYRLNDRCRWAIQDGIEGNIDGSRLKEDVVKTLTEEHGAERVGMILAGSVRYAEWGLDDPSEENSAWAREYPIPADIDWKMRDGYLTVNAPPAVLDGYVDSFRQEGPGQEKKMAGRTGPGRSVEARPEAVKKESLLARLKEKAPKPEKAGGKMQEKDRGRQRGEAR